MSEPVVQEAPENTDPIFVPYSVGIVAANKPLDSWDIEVMAIKDNPMINGSLTDTGEGKTAKGSDQLGSHYQTQANVANTITAKWSKYMQGNRLTPPDVRRGAEVMIYRMADVDGYWWTTLGDDSNLRKLETVVYGWSATTNESAKTDKDNAYYLEVSTHQKKVTFKTSQANGEPIGYTFQFDTDLGKVTLIDTLNNYIHLDSQEHLIRAQNNDGAFWELNKRDISMSAPDNISMKAGKNITMSAGKNLSTDAGDSSTFKSSNTSTTDATNIIEDAALTTIKGNLSTASGKGGSDGSGVLNGTFRVRGSLNAEQDLTAEGKITGNQVESILAFIGPNVN